MVYLVNLPADQLPVKKYQLFEVLSEIPDLDELHNNELLIQNWLFLNKENW